MGKRRKAFDALIDVIDQWQDRNPRPWTMRVPREQITKTSEDENTEG